MCSVISEGIKATFNIIRLEASSTMLALVRFSGYVLQYNSDHIYMINLSNEETLNFQTSDFPPTSGKCPQLVAILIGKTWTLISTHGVYRPTCRFD